MNVKVVGHTKSCEQVPPARRANEAPHANRAKRHPSPKLLFATRAFNSHHLDSSSPSAHATKQRCCCATRTQSCSRSGCFLSSRSCKYNTLFALDSKFGRELDVDFGIGWIWSLLLTREISSDADAEVLADYVIALITANEDEGAVRRGCLESLVDFLGDSGYSVVRWAGGRC